MTDIVLRDARYSELPEIAHVMARAFWHDNLFGDLIHPHREAHPDDTDLYWLRRSRVNFWNWRWRFLVAVSRDQEGREVIAGIAQWARLGDGGRKMDLYRLDPRKPKLFCHFELFVAKDTKHVYTGNLLAPLSSFAMRIHKWLWLGRAIDPVEEDIIERAYPCFDGIWTGDRAESWYLEGLAVKPSFQGRGIGYQLVQWGLERAQTEGVVASVVSALGTNGFYRKCGFEEQWGSARDGEGNPLKDVEGADIFWRWPKKAT